MKKELSIIGLGFLVVYYLHVDGPWAFLGFLDLELDYVSSVEVVAVAYVSAVAEDVLTASLGLDEAEPVFV